MVDSFMFQEGFPLGTAPDAALALADTHAREQAGTRGWTVTAVTPLAISGDAEMIGNGQYLVSVTVDYET